MPCDVIKNLTCCHECFVAQNASGLLFLPSAINLALRALHKRQVFVDFSFAISRRTAVTG